MAIKKADRYTQKLIHISELDATIDIIQKLGMFFFVMGRNVNFDGNGMCRVFIFFDDAGMENYLTRLWGDTLSDVSQIIVHGERDNIPAEQTLGEIREACGFTKNPMNSIRDLAK